MSRAATAKQGQGTKASDARRKKPVPAAIMLPRLLFIASASLLVIIGLVMIFSASSITAMKETGDAAYYFKNQLKFVIIGIPLVAVAAYIPFDVWNKAISWLPWALVVVLLGFTAVMGVVGLGAQRWIELGPLGGFQPSELGKIAILLVFAYLVAQFQTGELAFKDFMLRGLVAVGLPFVLILAQPDLGTSIIVFLTVLFVLWMGEVDSRPILALLVFVFIAATVAIISSPYRLQRFAAAFFPWSDPLGDGYQLINSLYAFGSGGIFGVGLGLSRQKYLYLPEAHTDFIFAVIGEEAGLLGATVVVLLFIVFIYAGMRIARGAPSLFGRMLAGGATATIGIQSFINMACTVGLFPVTGKPLPFVSSGGSSLLATLILTGLVLSVSFHSALPDAAEMRRMDMRVIDGGADKPRARGSSVVSSNKRGYPPAGATRASSADKRRSADYSAERSKSAARGKNGPTAGNTRHKGPKGR